MLYGNLALQMLNKSLLGIFALWTKLIMIIAEPSILLSCWPKTILIDIDTYFRMYCICICIVFVFVLYLYLYLYCICICICICIVLYFVCIDYSQWDQCVPPIRVERMIALSSEIRRTTVSDHRGRSPVVLRMMKMVVMYWSTFTCQEILLILPSTQVTTNTYKCYLLVNSLFFYLLTHLINLLLFLCIRHWCQWNTWYWNAKCKD